jgi:hypothetical protein
MDRDCLVSEEGGGGVRDRVWQGDGAPREIGRDHGLVLAPRRNRALIPEVERYPHQLIGMMIPKKLPGIEKGKWPSAKCKWI